MRQAELVTCGEEEKCWHSRGRSTWIAQLCYIWWETVYLGWRQKAVAAYTTFNDLMKSYFPVPP